MSTEIFFFFVNSIRCVTEIGDNSEILGLVNIECLNKRREPHTLALMDLGI